VLTTPISTALISTEMQRSCAYHRIMEQSIFLPLTITRRTNSHHWLQQHSFQNTLVPNGVSLVFKLPETPPVCVPSGTQTLTRWSWYVVMEAITSLDSIHKEHVRERYMQTSWKSDSRRMMRRGLNKVKTRNWSCKKFGLLKSMLTCKFLWRWSAVLKLKSDQSFAFLSCSYLLV